MKSNWIKVLAVAILVVAVGLAAPVQSATKQQATRAKPAAKAKAAPKKGDPKAKPVAKTLPKLLDLGATKCIPCKMMAPILEELKKEYKGRLTVEFIDVWEKKDAARKYGIKSIPTQIFFDAKRKEFFRHTGFFPKDDILKTFKEHGIDLRK